jgi:FtsP/CotA-like multicopper oxidase with cupredoxin domain
LKDQEDPDFCAPTPGPSESARQGACAGRDNTADGGDNYEGGKWYFTLNGQTYPTVSVRSSGEVWRLTNSSGSRSYDLSLFNRAENRNMLFQILSIDGVSVDLASGVTSAAVQQIAGKKFRSITCPQVIGAQASGLCTDRLLMLPSSRVEVLVSYRDQNGNLVPVRPGAAAVLRTKEVVTGPIGDSWPAADLAAVEFQPGSVLTKAVTVKGEAEKMRVPTELSREMAGYNSTAAVDPACTPLAPGHMRRIYFAAPTTNPDAFGLAYEEIDEKGQVVGTPVTDVSQFDPMKPTICLPLGAGNTPRVERWQLVNLAGEDHNFHLHQVKFRIVGKDEIAGTAVPGQVAGRGVMLDNLPLEHAAGTCGNNPPDDATNPITDFRAGLCTPNIVTVEIPFTIAGDFVYHCHIMEHEDGGMMARIRVRASR